MKSSEPFGQDDEQGAPGARRAARPEPSGPNPFVIGGMTEPAVEEPALEKLVFGRIAVNLKAGNPLLVAAVPVLAFVQRMRETPDQLHSLRDIRGDAQRCIQKFRAAIARSDVDDPTEHSADHVLCALVDDIALNGPWPGKSEWRQQPLAGPVRDPRGHGQRVFDLLDEVLAAPDRDYELLELIYVALALGFEGPLRADPRGPLLLVQYRERLLAAIRKEGPGRENASVGSALQGNAHKVLAYLNPFTMLLGGVLFIAVSLAIALLIFGEGAPGTVASEPEADLVAALRAELQPVPDLVPGKVRSVLQGDVATKMLSIEDAGASLVVRLPADAYFEPGTATLDPAGDGVLRRVGAAIGLTSGPVYIVAVRDPAAGELALARADAIGRQLAPWVKDRGEPIISFVTAPAEGDEGAAAQQIRVVLGKGVRPPSLADDGYLVPTWY
jgi:type VI secretion system protein ImpK